MELVMIGNSEVTTMSSREIAQLTGKEHKNVLADIRKMLDDLGHTWAEFSADLPDSYGRMKAAYKLPKRESMILVSGYSTELRARIIDRWQELESKQSNQLTLPNFTDPAEAAIAWASEYKSKQLALKQLEIAAPKVEFVDKYVERGNLKSVTEVAKEMQSTGIALGRWLRAEGHAWKSKTPLMWTDPFIQNGYGEMKHTTSGNFDGSQAMITPEGNLFVKQNFNPESKKSK